MLSKPHVMAALRAHGDALLQMERHSGEQMHAYAGLAAQAVGLDEAALRRRLAGVPRPGALPTVERVAGLPLTRPFARRWENHTEARRWAAQVLADVTVVAVDGSQITPDPDYSLPVGAVQVGWFANPHDGDSSYVKDVRFEVLLSDATSAADGQDGYPDQMVNARRFELECEVLCDQMRRLAREASVAPSERPAPLCLFDGSLVISFAAQMRPALQARYLDAVRGMLATSEETRVPLVGYVDHSRARDLAWMLHWLSPGDSQPPEVTDAGILAGSMPEWGDRSEAFSCARDDGLFRTAPGRGSAENPAGCYYGDVAFLYLRTTLSHPPSRLDVPRWVLDEGRLEEVVDVVRAECAVGTGYPYAMETADALAVIAGPDRERFYRLFQEYVEGLNLPLRYARKAYSKRQRR